MKAVGSRYTWHVYLPFISLERGFWINTLASYFRLKLEKKCIKNAFYLQKCPQNLIHLGFDNYYSALRHWNAECFQKCWNFPFRVAQKLNKRIDPLPSHIYCLFLLLCQVHWVLNWKHFHRPTFYSLYFADIRWQMVEKEKQNSE